MAKKKLATWESELGFIAPERDPDEFISEEEAKELVMAPGSVHVDHTVRKEFLKDNNHELTRENMVDTSL